MTNKEHIERTKRMIEVMQAYVDGEEIMGRDCVATKPSWNWLVFDYRIKKNPDSINWDHVAPDFKYMARDEDGKSWLFVNEPKRGRTVWYEQYEDKEIESFLFTSYKRGNVDWKDSLVIRPGAE